MSVDRKLGDEWINWNGDLGSTELDVETGKRVFLGFSILAIFIVNLGVAFIWYLIKPRIVQLNQFFAGILEKLVIIFTIALLICFILTVLSIIINKNLIISFKNKKFSVTFLTPLILSLGKKFGVSYDRMGNSFIKVSNSLITITQRKIDEDKLIIILPRCLARTIKQKIDDFHSG